MSKSKIEWTEETWNPLAGCSDVSIECLKCYARGMSVRTQAMNVAGYENVVWKTQSGSWKWTGKIVEKPWTLDIPLKKKKSTIYFVNSMSDLFHENASLEYIQKVFEVMNNCPQHTFQVLTKRAERLLELSDKLSWSKNIWMGTSVGNAEAKHRIDYLRQTGAKIKFLSLEPLIGPLGDINLTNINWAIVGAESGHGARAMELEWARDILKQCRRYKTAFFMKQLCNKGIKMPYDLFPKDLMVREYPVI